MLKILNNNLSMILISKINSKINFKMNGLMNKINNRFNNRINLINKYKNLIQNKLKITIT